MGTEDGATDWPLSCPTWDGQFGRLFFSIWVGSISTIRWHNKVFGSPERKWKRTWSRSRIAPLLHHHSCVNESTFFSLEVVSVSHSAWGLFLRLAILRNIHLTDVSVRQWLCVWSIKVSLFSSKIPSHACSAIPLWCHKDCMCFIKVDGFTSTRVRSLFFAYRY